MSLKILVPILLVIVLLFLGCKPKKYKNKLISEWEQKVASAELNKELFNKAKSIKEKEDLIYFFTQKMVLQDDTFSKIPKTLKVLYFVNQLEAEVNNGGFLQFFTNSSGKYANETIESLELIEADETKKLLERAIDIILKHNQSHKKLNKKINNLKLYKILKSSEIYDNEVLIEEIGEINTEFYKSKEPIQELKIKYFEKNQEQVWAELK